MGSTLRRGVGIAVLTALTGAMCSATPAQAALPSPVANAYVASADAIGSIVSVAPVPVSDYPPGGTTTQVGLNVGPFVTSSTLTARTAGDPAAGTSSASATVQTIAADFGAIGSLSLTGVRSSCNATPTGATGSGVISAGTATVDALPPVALQANAAPNTVVNLAGLGTLTLNEQTTDADGVITVNAVHLELLPEFDGADVIVGHVECGGAAPAPTVTKTAAEGSFVEGQTIHYTFGVTNNGTEPLTNLQVTDSGPGSPTVTCPGGPLVPGASVECTASYTATAADVAAGRITDTGTVTATLPDGGVVTATSAELVIPLRALSLTKAATEANFDAPGEKVHYTYTVTNTGQAPLTDVTVTDLTPSVTVSGCGTNQLAPGETTSCQATYTTTAADVEARSIVDQGTVTGTAPDGSTVTATSNRVTTPLAARLAVRASGPDRFTGAGESLGLRFKVTNTSGEPLTSLQVVVDSLDVECPQTTLAPGESITCTAIYETTRADVKAGKVVFIATATATAPDGSTVTATSKGISRFVPQCDDRPRGGKCQDHREDHWHKGDKGQHKGGKDRA